MVVGSIKMKEEKDINKLIKQFNAEINSIKKLLKECNTKITKINEMVKNRKNVDKQLRDLRKKLDQIDKSFEKLENIYSSLPSDEQKALEKLLVEIRKESQPVVDNVKSLIQSTAQISAQPTMKELEEKKKK